jgi:hypothetical protein
MRILSRNRADKDWDWHATSLMGHRLKLGFQRCAALPRPPKTPHFDPGIAQGTLKR